MTILVTGASGTVGRHLAEQLLAAGHAVRALTRNPDRTDLPAGVQVVGGDLAHPTTLEQAFDGVTGVHLITFTGAGYEPLTTGKEIVALAAAAGVTRATVLKGGWEPSPVEEALAGSDLTVTTLTPVEFMSNALEWRDGILSEGVVREGFATARSAMVHEADIAAVAAAALTSDSPSADHVITGPEALTVAEAVAILAEAVGREIRFVELDEDGVCAKWRAEGYTEDDIAFFLQMRKDNPEQGRTVLPTVQDVTGRAPRTFALWAREHAAAFRS
jgi:uncharacterized protein YbjT (DUF2867 family)